MFDLDEHPQILNKGTLLDKTLWIDMEVPSLSYSKGKRTTSSRSSVMDSISLTDGGTSRFVSFVVVQVESVGRFNDIFAKVRPENFLRLTVANSFSLGGRTNWHINQIRHSTNSEAVRIGRILDYAQR